MIINRPTSSQVCHVDLFVDHFTNVRGPSLYKGKSTYDRQKSHLNDT